MKVIVSPDGQLTVIAHADLQPEMIRQFGDVVTVHRIGHVVPANPVKRFAFNAIRRFFTGTHPVANWTRTWRGPWIVTVKDQQIGPDFESRSEAIRFEENWAVKND